MRVWQRWRASERKMTSLQRWRAAAILLFIGGTLQWVAQFFLPACR